MSLPTDFEPAQPGMGFATMLRSHRRAVSLTQQELAHRAGLGVRTVRDLESGRAKRPQRGTVLLLADALGLTGAARNRFEVAARSGGGSTVDLLALPPMPDLVGRDGDIDELVRLIVENDAVALLGLAGVGKTCLAVAVAHHAAGYFPGGVAGVTVTDVASDDDLLASVAAAFGVARAEALPERCGGGSTLLLIDAVDQQPDAAAAAVRWLRAYAPGLHLLATSRQPLDVVGLVSWPVFPLDTPAATELFARRLRQVRAEPLRPAEQAAVDELLRRMGGLPLAIELAAARGRVLTVEQLLDRYRDRVLDLGSSAAPSTGGGAGAGAGETLRDAVAAGYRLLDAADQAALRRLSVVRGAWSVELAETLLADRSSGEVEALLARLVGLGLVSARGTGQWRFRLLAVVREYAIERCTAAGELPAVRARHAIAVADLVAAIAPRIPGPAMRAAVSTLDDLAPDIRAALAHAAETQPLTALRIAAGIARWCRFRGRDWETRALLRELLADPRTAAADPILRADALIVVALLAAAHGDGPTELAPAEQALALYVAHGEVRGELAARGALSRLYLAVGSYPASRAHGMAALALARRTERARDVAVAQRMLAYHEVAAGDLAAAHRRLATVARLAVGTGDERLVALATAQLAEVARLDGRYPDAAELGRRAAGRLAEYGDPDQRSRAVATVAAALAESDRLDEASALLPQVTCPGLHALVSAYLARARGAPAEAAKLFAAAAESLTGRSDHREVCEALVGAVGCAQEPGQQAAYREQLDAALAHGVSLLPRDLDLLGLGLGRPRAT